MPPPKTGRTRDWEHPLSPPALGVGQTAGLRVLVVDDNEVNLQVAQGLLEAGGLRVDGARNGAEAVDQLTRAADHTYAAVLMDMQMPVMDGLSATRALRALPRFEALPIIAMTANATTADMERTRACGMNDHIAKPLLEAPLWQTLSRWLARPASALPAHHAAGTMPPPPAPEPSPTSAEAAAAQTPAFDVALLQDLQESITTARLLPLIAQFVQDCERRVARITEAAQARQWEALRRQAHDLGGTAGSFGLSTLGELTRPLEAAAKTQDAAATDRCIAELQQLAQQGLEQLRAHAQALETRPPTRAGSPARQARQRHRYTGTKKPRGNHIPPGP